MLSSDWGNSQFENSGDREFDRDMWKMECADKARQNKTGGYEGCRNFKGNGGTDKCDTSGYYCATYSPEGLCFECMHPEDVHGCSSCRKIIRSYIKSCCSCFMGFYKWALELFSPDSNPNVKSKRAIHDGILALHRIEKTMQVYGEKIPEELKSDVIPAIGSEKPDDKDVWPGFYCGDQKWIQLNALEYKSKIDTSDITSDNKCLVLNRELNKIGIFLYKTIQYVKPEEKEEKEEIKS